MSSAKKQTRCTNVQVKKLVEYMSLNTMFANGEFTGPLGSRKQEAQWSELKELLKEIGPDKTIEQWKQTWRDLKRRARRTNAEANEARAVTGNIISVPAMPVEAEVILPTIGHACSTGIGPDESQIGQSIIVDNEEIHADLHINFPTQPSTSQPSTSQDYNTTPLVSQIPRTRYRHRREETGVPAKFVKLQEQQNVLLNRICNLLEESNKIKKEHNIILREKNRLKKIQIAAQKK